MGTKGSTSTEPFNKLPGEGSTSSILNSRVKRTEVSIRHALKARTSSKAQKTQKKQHNPLIDKNIEKLTARNYTFSSTAQS
ncbi:MAG: hypothetical protein Tsb0018_04610 [Opitutales bacterium]